MCFGQDVTINGVTKHTLFVANDNDFLAAIADPFTLPGDPTRGLIANPNQFFVFAFADNGLAGYTPPSRSRHFPTTTPITGIERSRRDGPRAGRPQVAGRAS